MVIISLMESEVNHRMFILRVNSLDCCKSCPIKIRKALSSIDGVYSVDVDVAKKSVYLTGEVDPMILVEKIGKMGKTAKLVNGNLKNKQAVEEESSSSDDQLRKKKNKKKKKVRFESDSCCPEDDEDDVKPWRQPLGGRKGDDDHEAEDYNPKQRQFDREICRNRYCLIHKRDSFMGDHPLAMHGHGPLMFGNGPFINAGYFGLRPPMAMSPFVPYGPRRMPPPPPPPPPPPFGFY